MNIKIYTDGATIGNGKPNCIGTSAFVVIEDNTILFEYSMPFTNTTNNRCELMAVINALEFSYNNSIEPNIYSDSQYVVNAINKWDFLTKSRLPQSEMKNKDLFFTLSELAEKVNFSIQWVKGHNGNMWNERADKLCEIEMSKSFPDADLNELTKWHKFKNNN